MFTIFIPPRQVMLEKRDNAAEGTQSKPVSQVRGVANILEGGNRTIKSSVTQITKLSDLNVLTSQVDNTTCCGTFSVLQTPK